MRQASDGHSRPTAANRGHARPTTAGFAGVQRSCERCAACQGVVLIMLVTCGDRIS